jgi:hypothetical protein
MSRPAPLATTATGRADVWIRRTAGVTVAGLAGIAGALSYSHMRQLAEAHGNTGWHAHTLPLSVDGVEIVASLVLLADRRTGCRSGWLPWAALIVGTAASLAANVATADPGAISRVIAGWPALALLIAVKLLSGMLEHRDFGDDVSAVLVPAADVGGAGPGEPAHPETSWSAPVPTAPTRPAGRRDARRSPSRDDAGQATIRSQASRPAVATAESKGHRPGPARPGSARQAGTGTVPVPATGTAALLPAARAAWDDLRRDGCPLTRDALAARLRRDGHAIGKCPPHTAAS